MEKTKTTTATVSTATATTTLTPSVETVGSTTYSPVQQEGIKQKNFNVSKVTANASDVVLFNTPVTEESVDMAIALLSGTSGNVVYLVLKSPGGSVIDGARLINYIKYSGKNIVTVCDNLCASMAFQIFQVGKKRMMADKAILMAHPASGGAQGIIENMYELIHSIKMYVDRMDAETATRSNIPYDKFKMMVFNNIWAETPEALSLGLADGVIYLQTTGFLGKNIPEDVLTNLKKSGKFRQDLLNVKGYVFKF
jgi:ATP-dependent Clp protease protease subunit